jgi:glycosyltransferase involved in cell wall biosynthesis
MVKRISVIIPAYNEEKRILGVLDKINNKLFDEIIVVDDGSNDRTSDIVKKYKYARLIRNKKNKGKSFAVLRGLKMARNNLVMLIDSDLINLTEKNISDLAKPVLEGSADVTISLRRRAICQLMGIDIFSGERVFDKRLLKESELKELKGYGLEVYINSKIIENNLRLKVVNWKNVIGIIKSQKEGFVKGWINEIRMFIDIIFLSISPSKSIRQILKLRALRVK